MNPIDVLNEWANLWSRFVWERLIESTLIFMILFGLWLLVRKRSSSQFGYWLFLLVLIKLLLPFDLSIPALQPYHPVYQTIQHMPEFPSRPLFFSQYMDASMRSRGSKETSGNPSESVARASSSNPAMSNWGTLPSFNAWLMLAWMGITLGLLIRYVKMQSNVAGIVRNAQKVNQDAIPIDFDALKKTAGIKRFIPLLKSPIIRIPVVWGVFRPCIVIPTDFFTSFSTTQTYWILHHELAHIRRRDLLISFCQRIVHILYFFHPIVWICNRIINQEREYICDDTALVMSNSPREDCGDGFLSMIERIHHLHRYAETSLGLLNNKNHIRRRMMRILDMNRKLHVGLSISSIAFLVALTLILLPSVRAQETKIVEKATVMKTENDILNITESFNDESNSLHEAAKQGDIEGVRQLLYKKIEYDAKDEKQRTPLSYAAEKGHKEIVILLIDKGADVNSSDDSIGSILHYAVDNGHKNIVEILLTNGSDVNAKTHGGYTPLYFAIWNNDEDMVKTLTSFNADVSITPADDYPPLFYAVWDANVDVVKMLVDKGARFDQKSRIDDWTALQHAANYGEKEMVDFFAERGAEASSFHGAACVGNLERVKKYVQEGENINKKDEIDWTPLFWAACLNQMDTAKYLIEHGAEINIQDAAGGILLNRVAWAGHAPLAELLISRGGNIHVKDKRGRTPLHYAAWNGKNEVVELLLEKDAETDPKDNNERTPLWWATHSGHKETVSLLISKGADVNAKVYLSDFPMTPVNYDTTPLRWACRQGHEEIVQLLLANGADINEKAKNGNTAMHVVIEYNNPKMLKLLLDNGADMEAKSQSDETPLLQAIREGRSDIVKMLIANGANIRAKQYGMTALHQAIVFNRKEIVKFILDQGLTTLPFNIAAFWGKMDEVKELVSKQRNVNAKDACGFSPLFCAACGNELEIIKFLIQNGADVNIQNSNGHTPLQAACWLGLKSIVEYLVQEGADVNLQGTSGCTPIYWASHMGFVEIVEYLLDQSAKINVDFTFGVDKGLTPLHTAARNGHKSVVELLLQNGADVNRKTDDGRTALSFAQEFKQMGIVELLGKYGGNE